MFLSADAIAFAVAEEDDVAVLEYLGNLILRLHGREGRGGGLDGGGGVGGGVEGAFLRLYHLPLAERLAQVVVIGVGG